jgi:4-hydroxybenzoate polyprenyltransferase
MPRSGDRSWLEDHRGNPSRWVALALAIMFGVAAIAVAVLGHGYGVVVVLAGLFVVCFDAAFGRRPVPVQIAAVVTRSRRAPTK